MNGHVANLSGWPASGNRAKPSDNPQPRGSITDEDRSAGTSTARATRLPLAQIASGMEGFNMPERRPFVARTGLEGRYDVDVRFPIYNGPTTDTTPTDAPLLKEAMEDALGLRLEARKDTRQALVIDRVMMPSPD